MPVIVASVMDGIMTSLANDQCFAPILEHDVCPRGSIFSHVNKVGQFADLVNHALFIFDLAEFTGACYESTYHLPSLIADLGGKAINQDGLSVSYERNTSELCNQRFLPTSSWQGSLKARSLSMRCLNGGSEAFGHGSGRAAIFGRQGMGQGLEDDPSVSAEPGNIDGEQIVLDEAPIFVLIGSQDGII
jgi:hypothetical protein